MGALALGGGYLATGQARVSKTRSKRNQVCGKAFSSGRSRLRFSNSTICLFWLGSFSPHFAPAARLARRYWFCGSQSITAMRPVRIPGTHLLPHVPPAPPSIPARDKQENLQ